MTQEQAEHYLATGGVICPLCESEDLHMGETDATQGMVFIPVRCEACGGNWTDEYSLTGVTEEAVSGYR